METFKLQKPLFTTGEPECYVYNENRSIELFTPLTEELLELFGNEHKIYVRGEVHDRVIQVIEVVPDQDW